jgi:hypothetical protein
MADPLLLQVADNLVAKAASLAGIGLTGYLDSNPHLHLIEDLPAALLGIANDGKETGPTRSKTGEADFFYHCIVGGTATPFQDFLKLYADLEKIVDVDPTLGGLAHLARVISMFKDNATQEMTLGKAVGDIFVRVDYRHARGTP